MLLSIILLNYNKHLLTNGCIDSIFEQYEKEIAANKVEIVVVDNASSKESVEHVKNHVKDRKYKNVSIIENDTNWGFGKGCNIGANASTGEFILFLNNDTEVKDQKLVAMTEYMKSNEGISIMGGQLTNPDGSKQASVGSFYTLGKVILLLLGMQRFGLLDRSPEKISEVDWVKGGLLMMRKDAYKRLHGFDEKIFMYTEDMELCYRAKKLGMKVYFYPEISVIHAEHGSTNRSFAIINIYKNLVYFYKKHRSVLEVFLLRIMLTLKAVFVIVVGSVLNRQAAKTYKEALKGIY